MTKTRRKRGKEEFSPISGNIFIVKKLGQKGVHEIQRVSLLAPYPGFVSIF
jgi:hypothetical protein